MVIEFKQSELIPDARNKDTKVFVTLHVDGNDATSGLPIDLAPLAVNPNALLRADEFASVTAAAMGERITPLTPDEIRAFLANVNKDAELVAEARRSLRTSSTTDIDYEGRRYTLTKGPRYGTPDTALAPTGIEPPAPAEPAAATTGAPAATRIPISTPADALRADEFASITDSEGNQLSNTEKQRVLDSINLVFINIIPIRRALQEIDRSLLVRTNVGNYILTKGPLYGTTPAP